jgi:hypothetical protein
MEGIYVNGLNDSVRSMRHTFKPAVARLWPAAAATADAAERCAELPGEHRAATADAAGGARGDRDAVRDAGLGRYADVTWAVWEELQEVGVPATAEVYNALVGLTLYTRTHMTGEWKRRLYEQGEQLLHQMRAADVPPTAHTVRLRIAHLARPWRGPAGLAAAAAAFDRAVAAATAATAAGSTQRNAPVPPPINPLLYYSFMSACLAHDDAQRAIDTHAAMVACRLPPDTTVSNCLIRALDRYAAPQL